MARLRRKDDGFTLIEAMIATFVFLIAFLGLTALQGVAITGAARAKAHTGAVNVAQFFLTRLQNEVSLWHVDAPGAVPQDIPHDFYPLLHFALDSSPEPAWLLIPEEKDQAGPADARIGEYLGHSKSEETAARYCVNYRVEPLGVNLGALTEAVLQQVMVWKIRVRVAWPKFRQHGVDLWSDCDPSHWADDGDRLSNSDVVELMTYATRERARGRIQ